MGLETNPTKVDDLNESWPSIEEPAEEGAAHIRNIKRAVKARATSTGQYGVTTLSSATDSESEELAATPKAVKTAMDRADEAYDKAQAVEDAIGGIDTSVGEGAVPVNGFWTVAAGEEVQQESRHPYELGAITDMIPSLRYLVKYNDATWKTLGSFSSLNAGTIRIKTQYWRSHNTNSGQIEFRILKNGSVAESKSESRADITASGNSLLEFSRDLSCNAGDRFEFQFRFTGLNSNAAASFTLFRIQLCTNGNPLAGHLIINPFAHSRFVSSNGYATNDTYGFVYDDNPFDDYVPEDPPGGI